MQTLKVVGTPREQLGKSKARALRRDGLILCELYGGEENVHFVVKRNDVKDLVYTAKFHLINLEIAGKSYECILKELQFHPVTDEIMHIDFQQLVAGRKVKVAVPILTEGNSPGVKEGGKLYAKVRSLKIKATPEDLVDHVTVDVSKLLLGESVRVKDIEVGPGIEVMTSLGIPVASVEIPRALRSGGLDDGLEEGEEGAEGEGAEGGSGEGDAAAKPAE